MHTEELKIAQMPEYGPAQVEACLLICTPGCTLIKSKLPGTALNEEDRG